MVTTNTMSTLPFTRSDVEEKNVVSNEKREWKGLEFSVPIDL